jgi:uncharacterized membrane protein
MSDPYPPQRQSVPPYAPDRPDLESLRTIVLVIYGLYAVGILLAGVATLIGIVLAYVKRDDARGTVYESHFRWAISTFWISLLITVIGAITTLILVGWLIIAVGAVWYIYRIVKGWLRANERRPVE